MMNDEKAFEEWAIVEMFGHQVIAGRVSEQEIGGCSFVRIDIPETESGPAYTKLLGPKSIYAITLTDEQTARYQAESCVMRPMHEWSIRKAAERLELPISSSPQGEIPFCGEDGEGRE